MLGCSLASKAAFHPHRRAWEACTTPLAAKSNRICTKYTRKVEENAACGQEGAALDKAKKRLTNVKTTLRRARRGGDYLKITRPAKKRVNKAKHRIAGAKERRRQACAF